MSGGKGGSTTSTVEIPAWLESAAQSNLAKANELSKIGYTPYYGADVAAMTPSQIASMQGTNTAALAFGMPTADVSAGMPAAQNYGGINAYSSAPMYEQALAELQARRPGQYAALNAPFLDPMTGSPAANYGYSAPSSQSGVLAAIAPAVISGGEGRGGYSPSVGAGREGRSTTSMDTIGSYAPGGVNTANPSSLGNRMAASLSGPQGKPTAADRPVSRSSAASGGSSGMGGGK